MSDVLILRMLTNKSDYFVLEMRPRPSSFRYDMSIRMSGETHNRRIRQRLWR